MKIIRNTFPLLAILLIASCNDEPKTEVEAEIIDTSVNTQSIQENRSDLIASQNMSIEASPEKPKIEVPDLPLDEYIDVNYGGGGFLSKVYLAHNRERFTDEQFLDKYSNAYLKENDQFLKNDMKASILPEAERDLAQFKGPVGVKIPVGNFNMTWHPYRQNLRKIDEELGFKRTRDIAFGGIRVNLGQYDFANHTFPLDLCGSHNEFETLNPNGKNSEGRLKIRSLSDERLSFYYLTIVKKAPNEATGNLKNNTVDKYRYDDLNCGVKITDENKARELESLITSGKLGTQGWFYYVIPDNTTNIIDHENLYAFPRFAEINFYNIDTMQNVYTQKFTWDKEFILNSL